MSNAARYVISDLNLTRESQDRHSHTHTLLVALAAQQDLLNSIKTALSAIDLEAIEGAEAAAASLATVVGTLTSATTEPLNSYAAVLAKLDSLGLTGTAANRLLAQHFGRAGVPMMDATQELRAACLTAGVKTDWLSRCTASYRSDGALIVTGERGTVFGRIGVDDPVLLARARRIVLAETGRTRFGGR